MLYSAERLTMPDELYIQKVAEIQEMFRRRVSRHETPPYFVPPALLKWVLECDDEILQFSLGKIGKKLKMFAEGVDFTHPDLPNVFDGFLTDNQEFAQECIELISLARYARQEGLNRIIPLMGDKIVGGSLPKNVLKKIDIPQNNRMNVRLLKNKEDRDSIRLTKRPQTIDLTGVYKKGEDFWNAQPDNFQRFVRFDVAYQEELKKAERKVQRYEELGCKSLAEEVKKSVQTFREHMEQSYYGFNRITMMSAAVIMAKSLGFSYQPPQEILSSNYLIGSNEGKILVQRKFFGKYNFDPEQTLEFSHYVSMVAGSPIFTPKLMDPFRYEPRVYPLHEFSSIAPEEVKNTVALLEAFPDANGKPIFDHFCLIVPGVAFPAAVESLAYAFLDEKGTLQTFPSREEAVKALDMTLIKGNYLHAIMVGEKDGRCYFISYFT